MKNWRDLMLSADSTIRTALLKIDSAGSQLALVVDENQRLIGTVSDGDIRRALLKGRRLSDKVRLCANPNPVTSLAVGDGQSVISLMRKNKLHQIPIVDDNGVLVGLKLLDEFVAPHVRENWVVLMVGGLGTRLGELTKNTPKPMLKVGDRPLLETIIGAFSEQGFHNFFLSVNYKADIIENHFGDGSAFGVKISYLKERKRLGTAGSLSLLPSTPSEPIIVANGDLLAKIDYVHMLEHHVDTGALATMGVSEYEFQIPYGVVKETNGKFKGIEEKPVHKSLVSAGVNILSPDALARIPQDTFYDMPSLFVSLADEGVNTATYTVHGYWLDIGRIPDFEKANAEIGEALGKSEKKTAE